MASTALQIDALWSGINDPDTGQSYSGAIVAFFEAGTTTPKAVWLDTDKTLPSPAGLTQTTLNSNGVAKVFGDGSYKINIYDPEDTGLITPLSGSIDGVEYIISVDPQGIGYDSIADMRAGSGGGVDGAVADLLGYNTPGDNGGGKFYWDATSTDADNGLTIIKVTSIATGRWLRLSTNKISVKEAGAVGDKTTDDTTSIENALAYLDSIGGGELYGELGESYRFTSALTIPENVAVRDINFYNDITSATDHAMSSIGTAGTPTSLTADADAGDTVIALTSVAGLSVGGYLLLQDDRYSGRWPRLFLQITDITALNVTVDMILPVDFLTANSATATPITPVENIRFDNVDIECSDSSDTKNVLFFEYANNINIENKVRITNHDYPTSPTASVGLRADNSREVHYDNVYIQNKNALGGNGAYLLACTLSSMSNVSTSGTNFGLGVWFLYGASVTNCKVNGRRAAGNRGIKFAGTQGCNASLNSVNGFSSGFKIEDSGNINIINNDVVNCGVGATTYGINVSHQYATGLAVRGINVSSNTLDQINGTGIHLDTNTRWAKCNNNIIRNTLFGGILSVGTNNFINDNSVFGWGANSGIIFNISSKVTGNDVYDDDSALSGFEISADTSNVSDLTTFTHNTAQNNALQTNPSYFDGIAENHSNMVINLGQRVMWANAAPTGGTFVRGDKVYDDTPTAGGYIGWVCTGSGSPGVWKTFGVITP